MTHSIDPVLVYVVDDLAALDRLGVNAQLTMMVGAALVTGTPIAEAEYFDRLGEQFRQAVEPGIGGIRFYQGDGWREVERG